MDYELAKSTQELAQSSKRAFNGAQLYSEQSGYAFIQLFQAISIFETVDVEVVVFGAAIAREFVPINSTLGRRRILASLIISPHFIVQLG